MQLNFTHPAVSAALNTIKSESMNTFRCSLTGAPYAVIMDDEIMQALESDITANPALKADDLVDAWGLRVVAYANQSLPVLRNANVKALTSILYRGHQGHVRVMTYMLTRLLFPHLGAETPSSDSIIARKEFSREMHDFAITLDSDLVVDLSQKLVAIDAYCSMPYWHTLWAFESQMSKYGIKNASTLVKRAFAEPDSLVGNTLRINEVILFMFNLMMKNLETDGVAGKGGSKLAQEILLINTGLRTVDHVPESQKNVTEEQRQRVADQRATNTRKELRVAWSAMNGKGNLPDGRKVVNGVILTREERKSMTAELAKAADSKKSAGERIKEQLAKAKGEKPVKAHTPKTKLGLQMQNAFAVLRPELFGKK